MSDGQFRTSWKIETRTSGSTDIVLRTEPTRCARSSVLYSAATDAKKGLRQTAEARLRKTVRVIFGWEATQLSPDGADRETRQFTGQSRCNPTREVAASWRFCRRPMDLSGWECLLAEARACSTWWKAPSNHFVRQI